MLGGRRKRGGLSLGGVLLVSAIISVLALGLTRLSVAHLWLSGRSNSGLEASTLANSAASAALARILERPAYGASDPDIVVETPRGRAVVCFSKERARELGIPHSTNNLDGTTPVEGSLRRSVQAATVHVVATSTSGDSRRTVEAVLRLPPFPWAIVAGGTLVTRERVLVASLPEGVWPPPDESELLPADLLANANDRRAVVLGGGSTITGDVESPGQIVFQGNPVIVKGEVRPGVDPVEIPQLHAVDYDPARMGLDFQDIQGPIEASAVLPLDGAVRRDETLEVAGLELSGAHLFVDGDLIVHGPVTGKGVLVCTGDVSIEDVSLEGATELAVVAEGEVKLRGRGPGGSLVRGLFYAGESFEARDITLAGVLITGRATAGVELENARVLAEEVTTPTTASSGSIAQATYRVGGINNGDDMPMIRLVGDFSNVTEPSGRAGLFEPICHLTVTPTDGGFPVTVSATGWAVPDFNIAPRTLNSPEEVEPFVEELAVMVFEHFPASRYQPIGVNAVMNVLRQGLTVALDGAEGGGEEPAAISITGDLSRFLPFEDRVRVVSWFEQ